MSTTPQAALLAKWTSAVTLRDGTVMCIRPLCQDDRQREIDFINSLSDQSRYFRLLTPLKFLSPHLLDQLMDVDYEHRMALVATVTQDGAERIVGIARYGQTDDADIAELGITVTDAWQGRGIAKLLMVDLMHFARWRGLCRLIGIVLPENDRMLALARSMGFTVHYASTERLMQISCDLGPELSSTTTGPRETACPLRGSPC